jgi:hypothetical protein
MMSSRLTWARPPGDGGHEALALVLLHDSIEVAGLDEVVVLVMAAHGEPLRGAAHGEASAVGRARVRGVSKLLG